MITPTHVVVNSLVARRAQRIGGKKTAGGTDEVPAGDLSTSELIGDAPTRRWFIFGGIAPDIGLYLLTAGAATFYPLVRNLSLEETFRLAFDDLFFNDPVWVTLQNTLHSPVVVGALALAGKLTGRNRLLSFALGCLLHTAIDIPVHHNDGPLLFFPFDWSTRFNSPVSYYDADHYGQIVAPIDLAITVLGGGFLLVSLLRSRRQRQSATAQA